MRKFVFIIIVLLKVTSAISQDNAKTITIIGEANKQIEVNTYSLTISLRQIVANGYQQVEPKSLSEVTQIYENKLKAVGIDFNKFRKNVLYKLYASYSEVNDISYYNYIATSEEEITKIIKQKMNGLTIVQIEAVAKEKTNEQWATLTQAAIEDAKIKAQKIATTLDQKIGEIVKIENSDTRTQYINMYKPDEIQKHLVTVTFRLE
ncbi:SIMPL domain-containing protein [Aquimarina sediminis]|uniref:SIMPL domain-containing protein n=1 Tax=Aquimarina sediminis TaxID=2070536 RepID=UPI000CA0160B|nr:SIMPL domain-containing protein [Aquimarina sediminis]